MRLGRRGAVAWLAAAATAVGVGGWLAVAGWPGSDAAKPAPNLTVYLDQFRIDEPQHLVRITLTNHEQQPVTVEWVQLRSPDFVVEQPLPRHYDLPPGGTIGVGLAAKYGDGVCNGEIPTKAQPAEAAVMITYSDGDRAEHRWALPDPHDFLSLLLRQECERQKIAATVQLGLTGPWEQAESADGKPSIRATLNLRLTDPAATVEIAQMRGSVLYNLDPVGALTPIDGSAPQVAIPVEFTNNRCDPHAVAASQQSFIFRLWLRIDSSEPIATVLTTPDDAATEQLRRLITIGCPRG